MRFAMKIAYLGSRYHGWQRQPDVVTVEDAILQAFQKVNLLKDLKICNYGYASRTDASVHSLSQIIAFNAIKHPNIHKINSLLPHDICIISINKVPPSFNPRYNHKNKIYRYLIPYSEENVNNMRNDAQLLEGNHNFSSFVKTTPNRSAVTSITRINIHKEGNILKCDFMSNWGFYWQQVRRMVTFLIACGQGKISPNETIDYLKVTRFPKLPPASPHQLILFDISFPNVLFKPFPGATSNYIRYLESAVPSLFTPSEVIQEFRNYLSQYE